MRETSSDNPKLDINVEYDRDIDHSQIPYIFWLKIIFGIIGGTLHYLSLRAFYYIGGFHLHFLLHGILISGLSMLIVLILQLLIVLLLYVSKKRFSKTFPQKEEVWRLSLRYTLIFFIAFIISASIALYIGI